ncbi:phage minor tail protein L [Edwardsiella tarda]|uniref:phage minor tail protein L n=1 Tax=Edwardsiella tarda TaxID=636 RepID=UPI0034DD344A
MQDIPRGTLLQVGESAQNPQLDLWEIDLTTLGGTRFFFHDGVNEHGEAIIWQGRKYEPYPAGGDGFEFNGKGPGNRPTMKLSNLFGLITGLAEDYDGLAGARVVRRQVYACFLDAENFVQGNPTADPTEEVVSRYEVQQLSELTSDGAVFTLSIPTETDGAQFPGRTMLADVCSWVYRSDECGYRGAAVADEFDKPTSDPLKDKCGKCRKSCELRNNMGRFGGFLSISKLSR